MAARLMCVVAHPDDECFAFGGALALAAQQGLETSVICLTDGQAASARGTSSSNAELGQMRREEFAASCAVLGVQHPELLTYQDGQLEFVEFSRVAGLLVERMRRYQPEIVVTFGQDGGLNTHADHMMVSMLTTAAFHWAGRAKRYPEAGEVFQPNRLFHLSNEAVLPDRQPPSSVPWTVKLDISSVLEQKLAAFRAHTSQAPLMERTKAFFEEHGRYEFYALAAGPVPQAAHLEESLFASLG